MPTTRRRVARRSRGTATTMTMGQYTAAWTDAFLSGLNGDDIPESIFASKRAGAAFYRDNGREVEAKTGDGQRSELYWWAVSDEPRDISTPEELQLLRTHALTGDEVVAVADRIRQFVHTTADDLELLNNY